MKKISILLLTMALLFACADSEEIANAPEQSEQLWTCGMHPHVLVSEAGQCPICKMDLVAVNMEQGATISSESVDQSGHIHEAAERTEQERNILYWRAPMDPTYVSDSPGKSPMGRIRCRFTTESREALDQRSLSIR